MARQPRTAALVVALLALLLALSTPAAGSLTATESTEWGKFMSDMQATSVGAAPIAGPLQRVLSAHDYSTPLAGVRASNSYTGGNTRLRRVVRDLLGGKPIKVLAVGGRATNGSAASDPGRSDYFARYAAFLARAFPAASVKPVRASAGLAPSAVVAACFERFVDGDADLVLLEMAASDGATMDSSIVGANQPKAYEALVRRILKSKREPALVLVQTMPPGMGNGTRPFYMTPETPHYSAVAGYYDVPTVSMRNALWAGGQLRGDGTMVTGAVEASDGATPTDAGHSALTDALVYLTQRTAQDLQLLPFGDWDKKSLRSDVPQKTMYGGVESNQKFLLRNATCAWARNASLAAGGRCPTDVSQMCGMDFSSWDKVREGYAKTVTESAGNASGRSYNVGGVVGGVITAIVVLLGAAGGLAAGLVIRKKRAVRAADAVWHSKMGSGGGLPITASAISI